MYTPFTDVPDNTSLIPDTFDDLRPFEAAILAKLFEGKKAEQIAEEVNRSVGTVRTVQRKPAFLAAVARVKETWARDLHRGEFGVMAFWKAKAMDASRMLWRLAKDTEDDRVRKDILLEALKFAGIRQPAPQATENIDRLIDQFTAEESQAFATRGEWPKRFEDQLARLSVNVLREYEQRGNLPVVETLPKEDFRE